MRNSALGREVRGAFYYGNTLNQLIIINLAVFLISLITQLFLSVQFDEITGSTKFQQVISFVGLNMEAHTFLIRPWGLFSHIFVHTNFFQLLGNLMVLYVFGRIFREFVGVKRLIPVYVIGGVIGGLLALGVNLVFPDSLVSFPLLIGASASVMAIVSCVSVLYPDLPIHLLFFGQVRLKFIALILVAMNFVWVLFDPYPGSYISLAGGLFFGALYAYQFRRKRDLVAPIINLGNRFSRKPVRKKVVMKSSYSRSISDEEYNARKIEREATLDELLDKISVKGIKSLSKKERELLDRYSSE